MQRRLALSTPGAQGTDLALDHCLAGQQLYLPHRRCTGDIQNGGGALCKHQLSFDSDQLFQHGGTAHTGERLQALLDATIGQRCDDFGRALGAQRDDEPKGPAHFDAVWVHRPAVEVFGLALHQRCPAGGRQLRHLQLFCEGQFLLGLAQTGPVLALIKHGAAQIAFQRQPPGLQLLLQHHRLCKALDQLEHRRQIVGDQNLRFQREFCLDGAVCARLRQGIPKNLQFHAVCSFPCPSLLERYAPAGCRMPQKREHRQNTVLPCKKSVFPED